MSQEKQKEQQPIEINRSQFMHGLLTVRLTASQYPELKQQVEAVDAMKANLEEAEKANQRINFYYKEETGFYFTFHPKKRAGFLTSRGIE